ncbi:MAG: hypothetical protein Q9M37_03715, partial [Desulfonauticus sp.]|nr:hypothetical protein [Desulfonauticus sp.]
MKILKILFLYLIIHAFNAVNTYSQELHLIVEGKDVSENITIDSIGYKNVFTNYKSLEEEINFL